MTIKESLKSKKEKLTRETRDYKEKLSGEVKDTLSKIQRGMITALIVGGSTFIAYKFFKGILDRKEISEPPENTNEEDDIPENQLDLPFKNQKEAKGSKKESSGSPSSELLKGAGEVIMLMLLAFAKSKLNDHLADLEKKNEGKD